MVGTLVLEDASVGEGLGLSILSAGAELTVPFCRGVASEAISSQYGGFEEEVPLALAGAAVPVPTVVVCDRTEGAGDVIVNVLEVGDGVVHWILPKQIMLRGHVPLGHGVALAHCDEADS